MVLSIIRYNWDMNSSKRNSVSTGPLEASGWNWAEKKGRDLWRMPSLVPSFILTKSGSHSGLSVEASTAKPWFYDVMKQRSVPHIRTGWLWLRWPYLSL